MNKTVLVMLVFLFESIIFSVYSKDCQNGYYICKENNSWFYLHGDSLLMPYYGGTRSVSIQKGLFQDDKWIHFVPVPNKVKHNYKSYEMTKKYTRGHSTIYFFIPQDTVSDVISLLRCQIKYLDVKQETHVIDTIIKREKDQFLFEFSDTTFLLASLNFVNRGKTLSLPIIRDSTIYYDIYKYPFIEYMDNGKRIRFKFRENEQVFFLRRKEPQQFLWLIYFKKKWFRYVLATSNDEIYKVREVEIIDKHIRDLIGGEK